MDERNATRPKSKDARPAKDPEGKQPAEEHDRQAHAVDKEEAPRLSFPVVGIGASAGGLEAFIEFFEAMPAQSGIAFVLVQHLPPDRESMVADARHGVQGHFGARRGAGRNHRATHGTG
jgi:chemotaxis response regulator CheB